MAHLSTREESGIVGADSGDGTQRSTWRLAGAAAAGAAISIALGTYGRTHRPTGEQLIDVGISTLSAKSWLATAVIGLVGVQLVSALWMFGRILRRRTAPPWLPIAHRWSGTFAFLMTLPVAYHCLWSLGFQETSPRVLVHSIAGCAFYGAMATKLLVLRSDRMPGWALPIAGSLLVVTLSVIWLTSSLWFFVYVA